ncbi:DUF7000 family protein [Vagococcus carniphilus]|uniref:DUF7000 domain-containing protein n=1 Tax=Vagococcus carniphilus TaxID=218144 RepID=A0A430ANP2_9ENTE|nr:hypothetical protein [Vagococcus carniphilus]QNN72591.1 hypothetical protein H9L18_12120 [Vagococcus carniphilus]RSU09742.1 hypothetical protein CBF28_14605 [Vagococcus carniphilus]
MSDNLSQNIKAYQEVVYEKSPVVEAYFELIHFVRKLRTDFTKTTKAYKVGNVSEGYMDFTYFPIFNEELREKKLKYGIVLNHQLMQFELWLMAHNESGKTKYWNQLKNTPWNEEKTEEMKYSVLEAVLEVEPDFNDLDRLSQTIINQCLLEMEAINPYL